MCTRNLSFSIKRGHVNINRVIITDYIIYMDLSFFGDAGGKKGIALRGKSKQEDKATLLKKAREQRQARQLNKEKEKAAITLQVPIISFF